MGAFFVKTRVTYLCKATHQHRKIGRKSNQERKGFLAVISLCQIKKQTIGITCYSENFKLSFVVFLQEGSLVVKWFFSDRKIPLWENIPSTSQTPTN